MPKLQEAKNGGFFIFMNTTVIRYLGWKKGDEIMAKPYGRKEVILKNEGKKK